MLFAQRPRLIDRRLGGVPVKPHGVGSRLILPDAAAASGEDDGAPEDERTQTPRSTALALGPCFRRDDGDLSATSINAHRNGPPAKHKRPPCHIRRRCLVLRPKRKEMRAAILWLIGLAMMVNGMAMLLVP